MDADPERVHNSLLAQVQDYANCNLFPGQESRSTTLHCMQSRLVSVAGSFPVCAGPVWGSQQPSRAREQRVEMAGSGWKSILLSLDLRLGLVGARWLLVMTSLPHAPLQSGKAHYRGLGAMGVQLGSGSEPDTRNTVDLCCLHWTSWYGFFCVL